MSALAHMQVTDKGIALRRQTLAHVQQMMTLRISNCFADRMQARGYHGSIEIDNDLRQLKISVSCRA